VNIARDCDPRRARAFRRRSGGNNGAGINNTAVDAPERERKKARSKSDKRGYSLVATAGTRCARAKRKRERERGGEGFFLPALPTPLPLRSFVRSFVRKSDNNEKFAVRSRAELALTSRGCRRQRGMGAVRFAGADEGTRSESTVERGKQLREQKNGKQL